MPKNYCKLNDKLWEELREYEEIHGIPEWTEEQKEFGFRTVSAAELSRAEIKVDEKAQIKILLRELQNAEPYTRNARRLYDKVPKVVCEYIEDYLRKYLKKLEDEK